MSPSPHVTVRVDLRRVRRNTEQVARRAAVPVLAVVKADAYGLGAARVAPVIRDVIDGFFVFDAAEAVEYRLYEQTGRRTVAVLGEFNDPKDYRSHRIQPVVWTAERAAALRAARPVLCVELRPEAERLDRETIRKELLDRGRTHPHTRGITTILFHPEFPVDIRHNAKIFREKLAVWAARKLA